MDIYNGMGGHTEHGWMSITTTRISVSEGGTQGMDGCLQKGSQKIEGVTQSMDGCLQPGSQQVLGAHRAWMNI